MKGESVNMRMAIRSIAVASMLIATAGLATGNPSPLMEDEFADLQRQIAANRKWNRDRLEREVWCREALFLAGDQTPVDVVWRRTRALLDCLQNLPTPPDLASEAAALKALEPLRVGVASERDARDLFGQITALRRKIAFKNPLLDFDGILFLKHNMMARGESHMVDQ